MQSLFGLELSTAQKVIVASVVILVLLALLGLFVRQIQGGRLRLRGQAAGRQRQPRLGVVDTYDLDRQRQLVLIRRDNIEHLLMIGGASDVVVETNILRSGGRAAQPAHADTAAADRPLPPFETLVPPSEPAMRAGDEARRAGLEAPDVLPPLPSRPVPVPAESLAPVAAAAAGVTAALAAAAERAEPVVTGPAPSFAREHAPAPVVSPGELDDMTRQLEEALKRPFSAVRPARSAGEAPVAEPPAAVEKPFEEPAAELAHAPAEDAAPAIEPPAPEPAIMPEPEPVAPVEPPRQKPLASDVEAELAAALGLTLEQVTPISPASAPHEGLPTEPETFRPEPLQPEPLQPEPVEPEPVEMAAPEPEPIVADEPAAAEPVPAALEEPPPAESPQAVPEPETAAAPAPKEIDPFSVDAIEAEFARLLGRDPKPRS